MSDEPTDRPMRGVLLTVAYDGTRFHGYQHQDGQRTVQGVLEAAIEAVQGEHSRVRAAGRTDAGVHAQAQRIAFDTPKHLTPRSWLMAINAHLPDDVSVQDADECAPEYNPRFDAVEKTYRYVLDLGLSRHPLLRDRAWHLGSQIGRAFEHPDRPAHRVQLDVAAMRDAAVVLTGAHDFRAFRAADDERENTRRNISRIEIIHPYTTEDRLLAIEVTGDAFMKNMVRIIAGTLLDVGRGRLTLTDVRALLGEQGDRRNAGPTAPACGLALVSVTLGRSRAPASR